MVNLRVCVPDATENYVQNPAFRYNVSTPWVAVGSTLTRTLDYARFNIASCQVVTNGAALFEGAYYRVSSLSGISDVITASIYVRGGSNGQKVRLRLQDDPTGFEWVSDVIELQTNRWKRIEVTGRCTGGNDMRLKVETADSVARAYTFYIDGAQMERKAYATTYCDGDQPGCMWNIVSHGSNSTRTADTREGGRWVALAGTCRPNNDIYVTVLGGLGMPPVDNITQPWSQSPGSFFQSQKILDRVITLNFTVKKESLRTVSPTTLSAIHDLRQQLVDLVKTDKTLNDEAFLFEYSDTDADKPLYIKLRYEAGLEGSWDVRNGWYNTFAVRFLAVDPLWMQDSQEVVQMGMSTTLPADNNWKRINYEWTRVQTAAGVSLNDFMRCFAVAPDGTIYLGGGFTQRIMKWDGTTLSAIGAGATNGDVFAMDYAPDGNLYVAGTFTTIGGVAANYAAKYNPITNTFSALGVGLGNWGKAVRAAKNGNIYFGGSFTTAGGVNMYYIARWDGLQWRTVGATSGVSAGVGAIAKSLNGDTLYVGGSFTTSYGGGVTYNQVCQLNISTNLLSPMGYGMSGGVGGVTCLIVGLDGTVYASGDFTTSADPVGGELRSVAMWNGGGIWIPMGPPTFNGIYTLSLGPRGEIYACGNYSPSLAPPFDPDSNRLPFFKWNGSRWINLELYGPSAAGMLGYSIYVFPNYDILLGGGTFGGTINQVPRKTTVYNPGTASCWPKLYISGKGTLRYIVNAKTRNEIFLNLPIFDDEEVFIDFAAGKITSTIRGDMTYAILSGSEIRTLYLLPGYNNFAVLITEEYTGALQLRWQPLDWSADSIVDAAEMV